MSRVLNAISNENPSATTWNGAISNATTGFSKYSSCLDYWSKAGTYSNRSQEEVDSSMNSIFNDDPQVALKIVFGLRLITRKHAVDSNNSQSGYGRRDEFYKAVNWMVRNKPDLLYKNLDLIPEFGSYKDFFCEEFLKCLDQNKVFDFIGANLNNDLLRKFLPQIRSKNSVRTERDRARSNWAKNFCKYMKISHRDYRRIKSSGIAHLYQKNMSSNAWDRLDFNSIPGRAMLHLISRKGKKDKLSALERHGQVERYSTWLDTQSSVKFNGYPYELTKAASKHRSGIQTLLYNKQFENLLQHFKGHTLGNVMCAIDTSGSMTMPVAGDVTAYDVCVSMGLVFSSLNVGEFKDSIVAFDDRSQLIKLKGSFTDRLDQIRRMTTAWGSTNFQSVIDLLVQTRISNPKIPVNEYPETLLVISDMQFNPVGGNTQTNYNAAMAKLASVGLGAMRIIWWCVNGNTGDFPSQMNDKGVYMISGFDPVNIKALMGLNSSVKSFNASEKQEQTPLDGLMNWLSQPIFGLIRF